MSYGTKALTRTTTTAERGCRVIPLELPVETVKLIFASIIAFAFLVTIAVLMATAPKSKKLRTK